MTDQGNPNPAPVAPAIPAGWNVNPATGRQEWWDGTAWGTPPAKTPMAPLAIIALILGGAAFLLGLVPFLGLLLAVGAVAVSIFAFVKKAKPVWMPAVGVALGAVAFLTGLIVMIAFAAGLSGVNTSNTNALPQPIESQSAKPEQPVESTEPTPIESEAPESTPEPEPTESEAAAAPLTLEQQQAVFKAEDYISVLSFSRTGLIKQLIFEGFNKPDSIAAVDSLNIDWNEQAAKKAQEYLDSMSFSRKGLIQQLEFEGFTKEQTLYGVTAVGF
jgi:hypothetical protein